MAAYGAAISLKNTTQRILQSPRISLVSVFTGISLKPHWRPAISLKNKIRHRRPVIFLKNKFWHRRPVISPKDINRHRRLAISLKNRIRHRRPPSQRILQQAYDAMCRLQKVLLKLEKTGYSKIRTRVNDLDDRIKEIIWVIEDLIESHLYDQIVAQLESSQQGEGDHLSFSADLHNLQRCVDYLVERVRAMKVEYRDALANMPEEKGEPIRSRIDIGGISSEMVGSSDQFERVRKYLLTRKSGLTFTAFINWIFVIGMAGVGKTTLAKKVFEDPIIQRHFKLRAWVKVGRK